MRDSRYVNVNVTAVCDDAGEVSSEETLAAQKIIAENAIDVADAIELMLMLGVHPTQIETSVSALLPKLL